MRFGFLLDPLETIQPHHDTTFALMRECQRRGHEVWAFEQHELECRKQTAWVRARLVVLDAAASPPFTVQRRASLAVDALDVVFMRKDPPVDRPFVHATQMIELAQRPFFINRPSGLRDANEKLFGQRFAGLMPRSLVTASLEEIRGFLGACGGRAVMKPLDGFGGRGIFLLRDPDPNLTPLLESGTHAARLPVMVQAFVEEAAEGDKRILVLDGEPIGAVLRVPSPGDPRCNLAAGGKAARGFLNARDREICAALAPELRARGLWLVGIDVIGRWLTEVNVTSPTGLQEIDALDGVRLEERIIDFAEQHAPR